MKLVVSKCLYLYACCTSSQIICLFLIHLLDSSKFLRTSTWKVVFVIVTYPSMCHQQFTNYFKFLGGKYHYGEEVTSYFKMKDHILNNSKHLL